MWDAVELREVRVFLTLAEELHFGATATRLGLTQSRVSQSLRELERKVGGRLFHRTSRRVTLSPLGERFRAEVGPAYRGLADALRRIDQASRSLEGSLRVGLFGPMAGGPHWREVLDTFERRHPGCEVRVSQAPFDQGLEPVLQGRVDLLAFRLPVDRPTLVVGPTLSTEPRVLAVAADHPLARRGHVTVEDLADHVVAPVAGTPEETLRAFIPPETPRGRPIRRLARDRPRTTHELMALVARGTVVHPTVASFADYYGHPDVAFVPITDMAPSSTGLVWHRGNDDPRLRAFVAVTEEILAEHAGCAG